jgi:hypothetical protein
MGSEYTVGCIGVLKVAYWSLELDDTYQILLYYLIILTSDRFSPEDFKNRTGIAKWNCKTY